MKIVLCLWALTVAVSATQAAVVVTAVNAPDPNSHTGFSATPGMGTDGGVVFDNRFAQTFLATVSGRLDDVALAGSYPSTRIPTVPLRVDVTTFSGGQPGSILGTSYIARDQFSTNVFTRNFTVLALFGGSAIELTAGTAYALVFRTDTVEASYWLAGGVEEPLYGVPGYSEGQALWAQNSATFQPSSSNKDIYFQVRVDAVPEPGAAALLAGSCGVFALLRPCRRIG